VKHLHWSGNSYITLNCSDGKEAKASIQQMANDMDESKRLSSNLASTHYGALLILSGNELRGSTHNWLSPPDPSTNHNTACGIQHKKAATWFFRGGIYQEWKSTGSLLWVHGKRLSRRLSNMTPSYTILPFSRLGQKCYLVRGLYIAPVRGD
jgi:hypothetical protein